ncbi:MAG: sulfatase-like hydrolase/transferase, partial [Verrucomicrobiota bacterium]|nr:sulfatase-like hydrolase/transferase [Verrucomicrobiota bacterium]
MDLPLPFASSLSALTRSLYVAPFAAALLAVSFSPARAADKLNVLFLMSDDLRPELGCYGAPVKTPNLDKLAGAGVRFDRAFVQYPLCNPSRASLLTGRLPTTTGVLDNETYFRDAHPDWVTLPQHFKNHGYKTVRIGKIYHGGIDDALSWSEGAEPGPRGAAPETRPPRQRPSAEERAKRSDRIVVLEGDGESHQDWNTAAAAIAALEKHKDGGPFFLAVGFTKPHSPPTAPKRFFDLYDPAKMELPPDFAVRPAAPAGFPAAAITSNGDLFMRRDASEAEAREMLRAYRASASWTDWNTGRVLDALDRLG